MGSVEMRVDGLENNDADQDCDAGVESAGRDLARTAIWTLGTGWSSARVVLLGGPGRTGAAGICAARHLAGAGVDVRACLADPAAPRTETGRQRARFFAVGGRKVEREELGVLSPDLALDALGGATNEGALDLGLWLAAAGCPVVSLRLPVLPLALEAGLPDFHGRPPAPPLWTLILDLRGEGMSLRKVGDILLSPSWA